MITYNNKNKCFTIDLDTAIFFRMALRAAAAFWMERGFLTTADDLNTVANHMGDLAVHDLNCAMEEPSHD